MKRIIFLLAVVASVFCFSNFSLAFDIVPEEDFVEISSEYPTISHISAKFLTVSFVEVMLYNNFTEAEVRMLLLGTDIYFLESWLKPEYQRAVPKLAETRTQLAEIKNKVSEAEALLQLASIAKEDWQKKAEKTKFQIDEIRAELVKWQDNFREMEIYAADEHDSRLKVEKELTHAKENNVALLADNEQLRSANKSLLARVEENNTLSDAGWGAFAISVLLAGSLGFFIACLLVGHKKSLEEKILKSPTG